MSNTTHTENLSTKPTISTASRQIRLLTSTAIFAAMITLMTAYICHVPVGTNGGYVHFGDGLIYIAATLLPTPYALAAAAIGGGLADLLTAPMWTIATIIIKMVITIYKQEPENNYSKKCDCNCNCIPPFWHRLLYCRSHPFWYGNCFPNVIIRQFCSKLRQCNCIYHFWFVFG